MLFNSYVFIFLFMPLVLGGYVLLARRFSRQLTIHWLVVASLFYYGWWSWKFLALLVVLMLVNAAFGQLLLSGSGSTKLRRGLLMAGIIFNLTALCYYKYAGFLAANLNVLLQTDIDVGNIVLPLGISFFTFQKIAFLVDAYRRDVQDFNLPGYFLFVSFFPQLIAGPIVHHKEMMPQFARLTSKHLNLSNFSVGFSIFVLGLFKKVWIADTCAIFADKAFSAVMQGAVLTTGGAWRGASAYAFQIYFDFSAYSEMAIGLARMVGIVLPLNFDSPYKASNIIEFWRRWHITLMRFLRDYLYFPLGGNRRGTLRRYVNLMSVMLLGGLWHGAAWTFVVWGGIHGVLLTINHAWHSFRRRIGFELGRGGVLGRHAAVVATFLIVTATWVPFRAANTEVAFSMWRSMLDPGRSTLLSGSMPSPPTLTAPTTKRLGGIIADEVDLLRHAIEFIPHSESVWLIAMLAIVLFAPSVVDIFEPHNFAMREKVKPAMLPRWYHWQPNATWAIFVAVAFSMSILHLTTVSPFLYFQF